VDGVWKRFPGVQALADVSLDVRHGEIHALVGENGAGKSTLIGCLAGVVTPDEGLISIEGETVALRHPRDAHARGISFIPQQPLAVPGLPAGRNVLLGMERAVVRRDGLTPAELEQVRSALARSGAAFAATARTSELSVAEVRLLQIARTLVAPGNIIVLDEPTAVLSEPDADALLERLLAFRVGGKAILYVSHRLTEVLRIADRVTVLRDGRRIGTYARAEVDRGRLISLMAKETLERRRAGRRTGAATGEPVLALEQLAIGDGLGGITLDVRAGEVVGIAGVQGSGHGALLRCIAGLRAPAAGTIVVAGDPITVASPRAAYKAGLVLVPADRRRAGIFAQLPIRENLVAPPRSRTSRFGIRRLAAERVAATRYMRLFDVRAAHADVAAGTLSGGNQQKVVLARAIESEPKVLLLEEPTQGIDVTAKSEVRRLIRRHADEGRAVVVATSEFDDLLEIADVIHVMCQGRLVATLPAAEASYERILHHALP
jgi:ribose transport system ATP-binding protein